VALTEWQWKAKSRRNKLVPMARSDAETQLRILCDHVTAQREKVAALLKILRDMAVKRGAPRPRGH
jgi:hypothetical protein